MRTTCIAVGVILVALLAAGAWLWADHTAKEQAKEAERIRQAAKAQAFADEAARKERQRQADLDQKKLDAEIAKMAREAAQANAEYERTSALAARTWGGDSPTAASPTRGSDSFSPSRGSDSFSPYKGYVDSLPDHGFVGPVRRIPGTSIRYRERVCDFCGGR